MSEDEQHPKLYGEATLGERLLRRLHAVDDGRLSDMETTGEVIPADSVADGTVEPDDDS